ncbi:MAG: nitroreductase family protein [Lentisphaeria bacterium]|nr:nitroreductase family protein [Lentisphaeria bacterium]
MEFYEVLKTRRSIRGYKPDAVPENVLNRLAEAVNQAPTACNRQPFKLLLVRDAAMRKTICANCKFEFLAEAPVIAVMMTNESASWTRFEGNPAADIDASIAMEHLVLAAAAEGLGTCWICAFSRPQMNDALKISAPWSVFALSPVGFAAAGPRPFARKPIGETVEIVG